MAVNTVGTQYKPILVTKYRLILTQKVGICKVSSCETMSLSVSTRFETEIAQTTTDKSTRLVRPTGAIVMCQFCVSHKC